MCVSLVWGWRVLSIVVIVQNKPTSNTNSTKQATSRSTSNIVLTIMKNK